MHPSWAWIRLGKEEISLFLFKSYYLTIFDTVTEVCLLKIPSLPWFLWHYTALYLLSLLLQVIVDFLFPTSEKSVLISLLLFIHSTSLFLKKNLISSKWEAKCCRQNFFFLRFFRCRSFLKYLFNLLQYCFHSMFWLFGCKTCGIIAPWPGTEHAPSALEGEVWTTELPGKSL